MFVSRCRSFLLVILAANPALQCSVDNLPSPFGDRRNDDPKSEAPDRDRFQAVVPAYTFQCSGRVIEWGACVQPGGSSSERYYIQFQVWRPTGPSGCYSLVGFNRPVGSNDEDGFLNPPDGTDDPLSRCVELSVTDPDKQIEVQSGDVVGYYVDHDDDRDNDNQNDDNAGIQWIEGGSDSDSDSDSDGESGNDVVVHYRDGLPREDIRSHYALGGPNPTECGFPISGNSASYSLSDSTNATPIINLTVTAVPMPTTSVSPSMPGGIVPTPTPTPPVVKSSVIPPMTTPPSTPQGDGDSGLNPPSATDTIANSPSPPSVSSDEEDKTDSLALIIAGVIVAFLIVAIIVAAILIFVVLKRRNNSNFKTSPSPALNNPSYVDTTAIPVKQKQSFSAQYYDYATDPVSKPAGERVYATLQPQHYETATRSENGAEYQTYDYTTIYEDPTSPSYVVGDFGMARDLMHDTYYMSKGGKIPVKWTAPEALHYKKYSAASDVWSYGMLLYEIWSVGLKPFQNLSNADVVARLQNQQCQAPPPGCPRAVYSIMVDCWNPEPHLRPTFDAVFRALRGPQNELLYWSQEDVAGGRHLLRGSSSSSSAFSDLQNKYITPRTGGL